MTDLWSYLWSIRPGQWLFWQTNLPVVTIQNRQPRTNSTDVAALFGKRHADVLRAYRDLDCSPGFRERNFALTSAFVSLPGGGQRKATAFDITKDGFTLLAMSFTGTKALQFKLAYIAAFTSRVPLGQLDAGTGLSLTYSQTDIDGAHKWVATAARWRRHYDL